MKRSRPQVSGVSERFEWNVEDKSSEVCIGGADNRLALFHPFWSNGTAAVRCLKPINRQPIKVYWEILIKDRVFGTSMMFGLTTRNARLHCDSFVNLIGEDANGWGLSHKGLIWHKGEWRVYTKPFRENSSTIIGCLYDGLAGTLTYYKDGVCLGVAFRDLHLVREDLYPTIASTAAKTEFTLTYAQREFCSLQERCRMTIRSRLPTDRAIDFALRDLIPARLIAFLKMQIPETQQRRHRCTSAIAANTTSTTAAAAAAATTTTISDMILRDNKSCIEIGADGVAVVVVDHHHQSNSSSGGSSSGSSVVASVITDDDKVGIDEPPARRRRSKESSILSNPFSSPSSTRSFRSSSSSSSSSISTVYIPSTSSSSSSSASTSSAASSISNRKSLRSNAASSSSSSSSSCSKSKSKLKSGNQLRSQSITSEIGTNEEVEDRIDHNCFYFFSDNTTIDSHHRNRYSRPVPMPDL